MLVQHFLENSAIRLPEKVALVCADQRLTYSELNLRSNRLAKALLNLGIHRGDRVAIFLDTSAEAVIALFAILKANAVFIMLSPTMKPRKLNYILKDSGARVLITHAVKYGLMKESLQKANDLQDIIVVGQDQNLQPPRSPRPVLHAWDDTNAVSGTTDLLARSPVIDIDLATIIYTSGSTGDPKGVMCAHSNVVAAAKSITEYLGNREDDIILNTLPLSFDYGLYQVLMAFLFGGTVILEPSFAFPYKVLKRLVEERVTGFPVVPTMVALLLQLEDLTKFDLSSLRYITNTAAALPVPFVRKLRLLFPATQVYSMYGLTECKRVSYLPPEELDRRPDSVGIAIPNSEAYVADENGEEVAPNQTGELIVRGSNVMQGYWNAPQETARRFREGRYRGDTLLYTGDLFRQDEDGYLYFIARKDDLIKTKGERVSPKEIENVLCDLEEVAEAAVIGVPDEILGQAVKAFVVQKSGNKLNERTVLNHCRKHLEPFMMPKYVEFPRSLPKSPSGKINKKDLH